MNSQSKVALNKREKTIEATLKTSNSTLIKVNLINAKNLEIRN
ncbi:MAG: hypothetical protein QXL69_06840 [Candidatus Bathyarchaeia archaeon]